MPAFDLRSLPWKYIGIALLALAAIFAILRYGAAKYDAGVIATDARWEAAAKKLEAESQGAADAASKPADQREVDFADKLKKEKRLVDEAIARGDSPLDQLFGVRPATGGGADTARP